MIERLLPVFAILAAFAIFFGYIHPAFSGPIDALNTDIGQYDNALLAATRYDQRQAELTRQRDALPPDQINRIQQYLPDGVDNVRLILDLNGLAARSGITLSGFAISGDQNKTAAATPSAATGVSEGGTQAGSSSSLPLSGGPPTDSIDLSVTATGTYGAFRTFLAGVENSLRPLDVVSVDVKSSATGVYTYGMTLRIYWLR